MTSIHPLPPGPHGLLSARPEPDLPALGYGESEHVVSGRATASGGSGAAPADFATRVVVRAPEQATPSGTLVVEWLNVSSGADAAPDWTFLAPEVLRRGHAWAGVSAQHVGVEGGQGVVVVGDAPPGLRAGDSERYGDLHHPGDTYSYDVFTQVARAVRDLLGDDVAGTVLAIGESQSAAMLTTYVNEVQPVERFFDGFLVHSRLGVAGPPGEPGRGVDLEAARRGPPVRFRDDLAVPVLVVQAEGDLFDRIGYLPARQPDGALLRTWEVAGSAHADRYVIGEFEEILGSPVPVNRGQQWAVVRAALRALDTWSRGGPAPSSAPTLEVAGDGFVLDGDGLARGGVRPPHVAAPTEVLCGRPWPGAPEVARLFGSTTPMPDPLTRWGSPEAYLAAYEAALDAGVAAGFLLDDDRADLLAEARPDLVVPPRAAG